MIKLSAKQKIQMLDKLASNISKVNLISLADQPKTPKDVVDQAKAILKNLVEYPFQTLQEPTEEIQDSTTFKLLSGYKQQLQKLIPQIDDENFHLLLPKLIELITLFRNNLLTQNDEKDANTTLNQLKSLLATSKSVKPKSSPYAEYEAKELIANLDQFLSEPLQQPADPKLSALQRSLASIFTNVKPTGTLDSPTQTAINTLINKIKDRNPGLSDADLNRYKNNYDSLSKLFDRYKNYLSQNSVPQLPIGSLGRTTPLPTYIDINPSPDVVNVPKRK